MSAAAAPDTVVLDCLDFVPELPCEFSGHDTKHKPDGPGAWAVLMKCPGCRNDLHLKILCDAGRQLFERPDVALTHESCRHKAHFTEFLVSINPIREVGP